MKIYLLDLLERTPCIYANTISVNTTGITKDIAVQLVADAVRELKAMATAIPNYTELGYESFIDVRNDQPDVVTVEINCGKLVG